MPKPSIKTQAHFSPLCSSSKIAKRFSSQKALNTWACCLCRASNRITSNQNILICQSLSQSKGIVKALPLLRQKKTRRSMQVHRPPKQVMRKTTRFSSMSNREFLACPARTRQYIAYAQPTYFSSLAAGKRHGCPRCRAGGEGWIAPD